MKNFRAPARVASAAKLAILGLALTAGAAAHAQQITLTAIERTGSASGPAPDVEKPKAEKPKAEKPKKVAEKKPCKKKGGGGLFGALKKTGLAHTLGNMAAGGGTEGYIAGSVARTAVDAGADAEKEVPDC